jgi:hypothetical protein
MLPAASIQDMVPALTSFLTSLQGRDELRNAVRAAIGIARYVRQRIGDSRETVAAYITAFQKFLDKLIVSLHNVIDEEDDGGGNEKNPTLAEQRAAARAEAAADALAAQLTKRRGADPQRWLREAQYRWGILRDSLAAANRIGSRYVQHHLGEAVRKAAMAAAPIANLFRPRPPPPPPRTMWNLWGRAPWYGSSNGQTGGGSIGRATREDLETLRLVADTAHHVRAHLRRGNYEWLESFADAMMVEDQKDSKVASVQHKQRRRQ